MDAPGNCPLTDRLNANQRDALALYNRGGGRKLPGLVRRLAAEQALFDTPVGESALPPEAEGKDTEQAAVPDDVPASVHREGVAWCVEHGILTGNARGDLMLSRKAVAVHGGVPAGRTDRQDLMPSGGYRSSAERKRLFSSPQSRVLSFGYC